MSNRVTNRKYIKILNNNAKAISAELLELNLKNKLVETGKKDVTRRNGKKQKNWREKKHQKPEETG